MNQEKFSIFLKELRNEKNITQQQLADILNVNYRTVSRWENAKTMPDFDILIELSGFYGVSIEELLYGEKATETTERKTERKTEETLYSIAEYTNNEKERSLKNHQFFAGINLLFWLIFLGLKLTGLDESGITEKIASFSLCVTFGMSIILYIYSSKYINKIKDIKTRLLKRKES